jgi:hypothetical protein
MPGKGIMSYHEYQAKKGELQHGNWFSLPSTEFTGDHEGELSRLSGCPNHLVDLRVFKKVEPQSYYWLPTPSNELIGNPQGELQFGNWFPLPSGGRNG